MTLFGTLATDRPDGPSWSPYLAIGLFTVAAVVAGLLYTRSRRK
ncbi:hypothetical protein GCM10010331_71210 [Streptomyces xanthochromogenes]|nr:hypothetical protein GCM10010331_71210 [Streptomyces xanthochromogenes]